MAKELTAAKAEEKGAEHIEGAVKRLAGIMGNPKSSDAMAVGAAREIHRREVASRLHKVKVPRRPLSGIAAWAETLTASPEAGQGNHD